MSAWDDATRDEKLGYEPDPDIEPVSPVPDPPEFDALRRLIEGRREIADKLGMPVTEACAVFKALTAYDEGFDRDPRPMSKLHDGLQELIGSCLALWKISER